MAELALVSAPDLLWRVERTEPVLAFSHVDVIDASSSSGNRFDVPGAGTLYASTSPAGAFAETLSRFRPKASLIEKMRAIEDVQDADEFGPPGLIDPSWFGLRRLRALTLVNPLPFVDVDDPHTHTYLTEHAASELLGLGLDNVDIATLRGPDRRVTRAVASWLYARTGDDGTPEFSGIRYASRLGPYECWAVFDGTMVEVADEQRIGDQDGLVEVMDAFGLTS